MCMSQWSRARSNSGFVVTVSGWAGLGTTGVGYRWVGGRVGNTGAQPAARKEVLSPSEAGPEALQGPEWWGLSAGCVRAPGDHHSLRSGPLRCHLDLSSGRPPPTAV